MRIMPSINSSLNGSLFHTSMKHQQSGFISAEKLQ